ncbi:MAG: stage II sporulation protein P [Clostridia bacterium]|nr:stage II sporulation protein P [Clostridia bacterium]MDQ7792300.1 stage II sporulation protein P [Clostridia bacterium]
MRLTVAVAVLLTVILSAGVFLPVSPELARAGTSVALEWGVRDLHRIVDLALPRVSERELRPGELLVRTVSRATGVDIGDNHRMVVSQLPVRPCDPVVTLPAVRYEPQIADVLDDRREGRVLVGIYHTHTGETYSLTDGVERYDGCPGGVVEVGRVLEQTLRERHGVAVAHTEKIHDVPYATSYLESFKTAQGLLDEHRSIRILMDIHRDSKKAREHNTVEIDGQEYATVLIIVGSDARQFFPGWQDNLAVAKKVSAVAQRMYPGLVSGVRVQEGRYNQYLHPGALLLEVGAVNNHTREALRSAELLADVIAEVLDNRESE